MVLIGTEPTSNSRSILSNQPHAAATSPRFAAASINFPNVRALACGPSPGATQLRPPGTDNALYFSCVLVQATCLPSTKPFMFKRGP